MIEDLKKVNTDQEDVRQLQDAIQHGWSQFKDIPFLTGVLLEDVVLTAATAKLIEHKLGRAWRGYLVTKRNAGVDVYHSIPTNNYPTRFIELNAASNVTIDVWVF